MLKTHSEKPGFVIVYNNYEPLRKQLIEQAIEDNKNYPQYQGKWDNYKVCRVNKTMRTKFGLMFTKGDLTICSTVDEMLYMFDGKGKQPFRTIYCHKHIIGLLTETKNITILEA